MITHVQQALPFPWRGRRQCSLQLLIPPCICAQGTHYSWVNQGSAHVQYKVCMTTYMASTGNRTQDLLILSPMSYHQGHVEANLSDFNCDNCVKKTLTQKIPT